MPVIPLFPHVVHGIDIEDFDTFQQSIIDFVYDEQKKDPTGMQLSNQGGWHSRNDYHTLDNPIRDMLPVVLAKHFKESGIYVDTIDPQLIGLWSNINKGGDYNKSHIHPKSDISGVIWVKYPKNSGLLSFVNPHQYSQFTELASYTQEFRDEFMAHDSFNIIIEEGRMVLFPSSLYHCVDMNESDEERISISFNINLTTKEGYLTS